MKYFEQIGLGIGFIGTAVGLILIVHSRMTGNMNRALLTLSNEKTAKKENFGLTIIICSWLITGLILFISQKISKS